VTDADPSPLAAAVEALAAEWPGVAEHIPRDELADLLEGVRAGLDRLHAIDVEGFEFDFLVPDSRAR
jgi:hypothetical protein